MQDYKDLEVWQKSVALTVLIYKELAKFPAEEKYGLAAQMRRAAISIPSNIAEGSRRKHNSEYRQFVHISLGSGAELETQIIIAEELGFISRESKEILYGELQVIMRMLNKLATALN